MLNFIGVGSAFNTDWGNNSAYMKFDDKLVLFDCGSLVFHLLKFEGALHGVNHVYVIQTHTHGDHIGSLSGLIEYMYYKVAPLFESKVTIITHYENEKSINIILNKMGLEKNMYEIQPLSKIAFIMQHVMIRPIKVEHVTNLNCFGYILSLLDRYEKPTVIYYSGDSNMIPDEILDMIENGKIDYLYQDTCGLDYEGNVHLSLNKLAELIKPEYRHKVYCMHRDEAFDIHKAQELGFNIANIKGE